MKIRHPLAISLAARAVAAFVRVWVGSLRRRYEPLGKNFDPRQPGLSGRFLYVFWHENTLLPAYLFGRADIHVLISHHADGQLVAEATQRLGFKSIRGSSTRGGARAIRQMLHNGGHLALTPDGPRGPRRVVQPGIVYLASRTGLPVVPFGVGYDRPYRARSWDRFAVPRPLSRAVVVTADPVVVPPGLDRDSLEPYRRRIQEVLDFVSLAADDLAAGRPCSKRMAA